MPVRRAPSRHGVGRLPLVSVTAPALRAHGITALRGTRRVLHGLDLDVPAGRFTVLLGGNGCGKTTLLHVLAGLLRPQAGTVQVAGEPQSAYARRALARQLTLLPQDATAPARMTVRELIQQGRYPWQRWWQPNSTEDERAIDEAARLTDVHALLDEPLAELSGGQRQRSWIAMTLAQATPIVLLDEPTTFLDVAHQISVLTLLARLSAQGRTIVAVLHDVNQAAWFADHLVLMREGRILAQGPPAQVVTPACLRATFDLEAHVARDPATGLLFSVPALPARSGRATP